MREVRLHFLHIGEKRRESVNPGVGFRRVDKRYTINGIKKLNVGNSRTNAKAGDWIPGGKEVQVVLG